jgi:aspartate 1-decarboxylase
MRTMLKSKIHRAYVTETNINYEGSITIDEALLEAADILPYELVHILDLDTGARVETYAIKGERNSGMICINGAAARLIQKGDPIIILSYSILPEDEAHSLSPRLVYVNARNKVTQEVRT